jgi:hypothetical protein
MKHELVDLIKLYLESVNTVLSLLKLKIGQPLEGKSWVANIPDNGHYSDLGISKFHRHGTGIWVYHDDKFIDFNFSDLNLPELDDSHRFLTIEPGFLARFIESLRIKNELWTDYSLLKEELDKLGNKGIIRKINNQYYLIKDLDSINFPSYQPQPSRKH